MTSIYILNGPPRSGKDSLTHKLISISELTGLYKPGYLQKVKFADCLKRMTHRLYGLPEDPYHYEDRKDTPLDDFLGITPRQAYISVSEKYIKQVHGKDFFGRQLCKLIKEYPDYTNKVFLVSDGGFLSEITPLIKMVGPSNIHVVYVIRKDCKFSNDSRSYLPREGLRRLGVNDPVILENDTTIVEAAIKLSGYLRDATRIADYAGNR